MLDDLNHIYWLSKSGQIQRKFLLGRRHLQQNKNITSRKVRESEVKTMLKWSGLVFIPDASCLVHHPRRNTPGASPLAHHIYSSTLATFHCFLFFSCDEIWKDVKLIVSTESYKKGHCSLMNALHFDPDNWTTGPASKKGCFYASF